METPRQRSGRHTASPDPAPWRYVAAVPTPGGCGLSGLMPLVLFATVGLGGRGTSARSHDHGGGAHSPPMPRELPGETKSLASPCP